MKIGKEEFQKLIREELLSEIKKPGLKKKNPDGGGGVPDWDGSQNRGAYEQYVKWFKEYNLDFIGNIKKGAVTINDLLLLLVKIKAIESDKNWKSEVRTKLAQKFAYIRKYLRLTNKLVRKRDYHRAHNIFNHGVIMPVYQTLQTLDKIQKISIQQYAASTWRSRSEKRLKDLKKRAKENSSWRPEYEKYKALYKKRLELLVAGQKLIFKYTSQKDNYFDMTTEVEADLKSRSQPV